MDDPTSFVYEDNTYDLGVDPFDMGVGMVWPYGAEHWCNLEGKYLHIVADLNDLYAEYFDYEMSLCTLGVFGT